MNFLKKKTFKGLSSAVVMSALFAFSTCSAAAPETVADLVVYGKVYTSNANARYADAFAVKDGKYIYKGKRLLKSCFDHRKVH